MRGPSDAGDQYTGLDRFGRVVDQRWLNGSNQPLDRFQYGYDADGNALYRDNRVNPIFGEMYHVDGTGNGYDGLNQLQQFARGTLSADKLSIAGTHYGTRVYAADAAGNFSSEMVSGVMTSRTHNAQNELTAVGGSGLSFDNAGNEWTDGAGDSFSYDAWNRLVSSSKTGLTEAYAYDALGRRTVETVGGTTRQLYYNDRWQVLEEEATAGGAAVTQYVWSALGSDHLVLRDRAPSGSGPLSEHFYVQQDVHGDVTALVNTAGGVSERYVYDPYGGTGYLNASWGVISASTVGWQVLFQGLRLDRFSLTDDRERVYAAGFERFMQNDPIGFAALDPNTYRFVGDNPVTHTDPTGLAGETCPLGAGAARAYVEWFPNLGVGELKVIHKGQEIMRYRWSLANPGAIEEVFNHAGKALPGISKGLMARISLNLRYRLEQMVWKAGGRFFSRSMVPDAIKAAYPRPKPRGPGITGWGVFALFGGALLELLMNPSTASAAEIQRPIIYEVPLKDLGLNCDLTLIEEKDAHMPDNGKISGGGSGGCFGPQ